MNKVLALRCLQSKREDRKESKQCDMYGNRGIFNLLCGQEEEVMDLTWGLGIREGILEVVTFSKAMKYKWEFVGWREGGKEGHFSLKGGEMVGGGGQYLCKCE